MPVEPPASLRAVVVAFNPDEEELTDLVDSLALATTSPYELIIVDNGEETAIEDSVGERYGARVIRSGRNLGYGPAANRGAAGTAAEWILILNQDLVLDPGAVDTMIAAAQRWPRGGAFGPLIHTPEGEVYPSARNFPRLVSGAGHALLGNMWPSNPFTRAYHSNTSTDSEHETDWLSGACLLLRREAFEQVGGFDESYFMFFEDTQLGEQMKAAGWQRVFIPQATVCHEQGTSWKDKPATMLRAHHESAAHYLDGVYNKPYQAPLRWALRIGLRARAALEVRTK